MSKQSEAKAAQHYSVEGPKCGNCKHRQFDMALPAWMVEHNRVHAEIDSGIKQYGDQHKQPKNQRCSIGGFAIKVQGWCVKHEQHEPPRHDAHAIKAQPVATPTHPDLIG